MNAIDRGPQGVGREGKLHSTSDLSREEKHDLTRATGQSHQHTVRIDYDGSHFLKSISTGKGALAKPLLYAWVWLRQEDTIANSAGLSAVDPEAVHGTGTPNPEAAKARAIDARQRVALCLRHVGKGRCAQALLWSLANPDSNVANLGRYMRPELQHRGELKTTGLAWIESALERVEDFYSTRIRND